jgi:hypothetical protein
VFVSIPAANLSGKAAGTYTDTLTLLVTPLRPQGGDGLLRAIELPGVGNILERVADDATTRNAPGMATAAMRPNA